MKSVYILTILALLIKAAEVDDLWSLALLLFDLSLSHSDLHVLLGE